MSEISELLSKLNDSQREAVTTTEGSLLIIAGAGSGKTRVITSRIAAMLLSGIPQSAILSLTFTNKAAKEMQNRIKKMLDSKLQSLTISTFHAFGFSVLRENAELLGFRKNFSIYDEGDKTALLKECAAEFKIKKDSLDFSALSSLFSAVKSGQKNWDAESEAYKEFYSLYNESLKIYNAVDFDDLIVLPLSLFKKFSAVRSSYRERYKYVMVDEFQDTSAIQYEFLKAIASKNTAVVGDDDQSIYSWRGASFLNIRNFEKDFAPVKEIRLEQNYRSTSTILEAANYVIRNNTDRKSKRLYSTGNKEEKPIEVHYAEDERSEALYIASRILSIQNEEGKKKEDFGILVRSNTQMRVIEEELLAHDIAYTVSGGMSFFERKEIKDVLSYLRFFVNHEDEVNLFRIINTPRRGIGRSTIGILNEIARQKGCSLFEAMKSALSYGVSSSASLSEFISLCERQKKTLLSPMGKLASKVRSLLEEIDYFSYLKSESKSENAFHFKQKNIEQLLLSLQTWQENFGGSLYDYLNRISLILRSDNESEEGRVNLLTIHAAKGLEFPVVFIAGAEEGLLPHERSVEEGGMEEERRLFYVAITRAKEKLLISSCLKRRRKGGEEETSPSPFIAEIPTKLMEESDDFTPLEAKSAQNILANMLKRFSK